MASVNRFIRKAREKLGLSQPKFAERLGISRASIARYEREDYPVPETVRLAVKHLLEQEQR